MIMARIWSDIFRLAVLVTRSCNNYMTPPLVVPVSSCEASTCYVSIV